jgi:hypothetical protein
MLARMSSTDRTLRSCRVRDIGLGGLYVEDDHLAMGDTWSVKLLPAGDRRASALEAWGRVVRVEPGQGTALEFTEMTLESFDRLDRLVDQNGSRVDTGRL